jgi:hypothetical protein
MGLISGGEDIARQLVVAGEEISGKPSTNCRRCMT